MSIWDVSTMTVYIDNAAAVMFSVVLWALP